MVERQSGGLTLSVHHPSSWMVVHPHREANLDPMFMFTVGFAARGVASGSPTTLFLALISTPSTAAASIRSETTPFSLSITGLTSNLTITYV